MAAARSDKIAVSLLKGLNPLGDLSQDKLEELAAKSSIQEFPAGRTLFRQGERDKRVIYLLSGTITLHTAGQPKPRQLRARGNTPLPDAIETDIPRPSTAKTKTTCRLLFIDRDLLEILTQDENSGLIEVEELSGDDESAWMVRFLQSRAFLKLPTENIQTLLMNLEEVPFSKGDTVIRQGESNDYYYIVHSGRCAVSRRPAPKLDAIQLAILTVGDGFGEEALITGGKRNASVTMLEDGMLMRLEKDKFLELLAEPLITRIDKATTEDKIASGALLIDVRRNDQFMANRVEGSVNIPLSMLRLKLEGLNPEREYVLICNDGSESAAAAFLLAQQGLDCYVLEGGLNENALTMPEPNLSVPVLDTPEGRKTLAAEKTRKAAEAKAEKISQEAETARQEARKLANRVEAAEAARREAEEKFKRLQQEEAEKREAALLATRQRLKEESRRAKEAEEQAAKLKLEAKAAKRKAEEELRRLQAEAEENARRQATLDSALEHARKVAAEAAREAEESRKKAEREAAEIRRKAQEEADRLRKEMEETRLRFEEETRRLKEQQHQEHRVALEEARRKAEQEHQAALEEARRKAEAEAERIRQAAEAEAEKLRAEMEAARRELAEQAARLAEQEKAQQAKLREQARREAEELARVRTAEAESEAERIRRAAEAEAEKLRREMEAARLELAEQASVLVSREKEHQQQLLEQARLQAEELARARTAEAESEAERIRREAMEEAERLRLEIQTTREMLAQQVAEAKRQAERKEQDKIRKLAEAAERKREELIEAERRRREAAMAEQRRAAEEAERVHREELERLAAEEARRTEEAKRLAEEKAYQEAKARRLAREKARQEAQAAQEAARREAEKRRKAKKAEAMRRKAEEIRRKLEEAEQARREEEARQRAEGMSLSEAVLKRVGNRIILEGAQDVFIFKEPTVKPEDLEEEGPAENFFDAGEKAAEPVADSREADDGLPSFHFESPEQDYVPIARDELDETLSRHEAEAAEERRQRLRKLYAIAASVVAAAVLGFSMLVMKPGKNPAVIAGPDDASVGTTTASLHTPETAATTPRFSLAERIRQERRLRDEAEARLERQLAKWEQQHKPRPAPVGTPSATPETADEPAAPTPSSSAADTGAVPPAISPPEVALPDLPPVPEGPLPSVSGMIEQNEDVAFDNGPATVKPVTPVPDETIPAYDEGDEDTDEAAGPQPDATAQAPADGEPVTAAVAAAE